MTFGTADEKCARSGANVRTAPFTSASITGILAGGDCVKVLSRHGNWYLVEGTGFKGYVFSSLLTDRSDLAADSTPNTLLEDKRIETSLRLWQNLTQHPCRRPGALKETIDSYRNDLTYLYKKRLRSGVKLDGKMVVEIKIKANGTVGKVSILQSDIGDQQFELSVAQQIFTWKFRPIADSLGELGIKYPFEFSVEER